jgi:hypothetical protein
MQHGCSWLLGVCQAGESALLTPKFSVLVAGFSNFLKQGMFRHELIRPIVPQIKIAGTAAARNEFPWGDT